MLELWKKRNDLTLMIMGPTTNEFEEYYSKLPKKFQEKIIDLNVTDDQTKYKAIEASDIVVLPSLSESFGLVYFEAWLCEKPVIGCNIEPVSEIINHKQDGLLVRFGINNELVKAISYLVDNPDICKQYGVNGKEKAKLYTLTENLKIFEEKCLSVIKNFKKEPE
jgi:glycosyltransferase involved in cell wall biosynthesis